MTAVKLASPDHEAPPGPNSEDSRRRLSRSTVLRQHPWIAPLAVGVGAVAATAYTAVNNPNTSHAFPLCPLKAISGIDCPACGGLRAVHSLTHLDIVGAADHNLAAVLLLPVAAYWYLTWVAQTVGRPLPPLRVSRRVTTILVLLLTAFTIARNVPIPGHDFLNSTSLLAGRSA